MLRATIYKCLLKKVKPVKTITFFLILFALLVSEIPQESLYSANNGITIKSKRNLILTPVSKSNLTWYYGIFPHAISAMAISNPFSKLPTYLAKHISPERSGEKEYYFVALAGDSFIRIYFGKLIGKPILEVVEQFDTPKRVSSLAFHPNGMQIAYGDETGIITIREIKGYKTDYKLNSSIKTNKIHNGQINSLTFTPDGRYLISASSDYHVKSWDLFAYHIETLYSHDNVVSKVTVSKDGKYVASGGYDHNVILYNLKSHKKTILIPSDPKSEVHTNWVSNVIFNPRSDSLVSTGYDRKVILWNIKDMNNVSNIELGLHYSVIHGLAFHPDNSSIASSDTTGQINLWKGANYKTKSTELNRFEMMDEFGNKIKRKVHRGVVEYLAFSPKGNILFSSSNRGIMIYQELK